MTRVLLLTALSAFLLPAQSKTNEFEVASIRPASPDATGTRFQARPGVFIVTNATLRQLISDAYDVRDFQLTGGESWVGTQRFDITAKIDHGDTVGDQVGISAGLRKRSVLDDRVIARFVDEYDGSPASLTALLREFRLHHSPP